MTNEEIIRQYIPYGELGSYHSSQDIPYDTMLNLARADEREKMQGVEIWVSRNKLAKHTHESIESMIATKDEPKVVINDGYDVYYDIHGKMYEVLNRAIFNKLNIQPGQCRKFKIVECVE